MTDNPKTQVERIANMQGVTFIDTTELARGYEDNFGYNHYSFCPRCVDDDAYKRLSAIMERNKPAYRTQ